MHWEGLVIYAFIWQIFAMEFMRTQDSDLHASTFSNIAEGFLEYLCKIRYQIFDRLLKKLLYCTTSSNRNEMKKNR